MDPLCISSTLTDLQSKIESMKPKLTTKISPLTLKNKRNFKWSLWLMTLPFLSSDQLTTSVSHIDLIVCCGYFHRRTYYGNNCISHNNNNGMLVDMCIGTGLVYMDTAREQHLLTTDNTSLAGH